MTPHTAPSNREEAVHGSSSFAGAVVAAVGGSLEVDCYAVAVSSEKIVDSATWRNSVGDCDIVDPLVRDLGQTNTTAAGTLLWGRAFQSPLAAD